MMDTMLSNLEIGALALVLLVLIGIHVGIAMILWVSSVSG